MRNQHIIESQPEADQVSQGIVVPLDLPGLRILKQSLQADGSIEVHVIATTSREICPTCGKMCVKIHDTRVRVKRDTSLRGQRVQLVLYKRRFRCLTCRGSFTEADTVCGRYKRTTKRWRDQLGEQACQQPIAEVAKQAEVRPRFVQDCWQSVIEDRCAKEGRSLDESAPLLPHVFGD